MRLPMQAQGLQWHLDGSACTWNHTQGEGVIVAIMDTGLFHFSVGCKLHQVTLSVPASAAPDNCCDMFK